MTQRKWSFCKAREVLVEGERDRVLGIVIGPKEVEIQKEKVEGILS